MIKVLHLVTSLTRGGIEKWLLSMLREIPRDICQMDVCCRGISTGDLTWVAEELGAKVYHCQFQPGHFGFAHKLSSILRKGNYNILHNHLHKHSGYPVWVAHRTGVPVITSFHNTIFPPEALWMRRVPIIKEAINIYIRTSIAYALAKSDLLSGCSKGVLNALDPAAKFAYKSRVLYYGVDAMRLPSAKDKADFRISLGWPEDCPLVIHVGRLTEQKNPHGLLAIFSLVLKKIPTAKLIIVGSGRLSREIEKAIARYGIRHAVKLLGPRDDVPSLLGMSDVFLFPSFFEGFGLVALEANAAGIPVVGSRIEGLVEAVEDGRTALLHDVNNINAMADSVVKIISTPDYADLLGTAGRKRFKENFTLEIASKRLLNMYQDCLNLNTRKKK